MDTLLSSEESCQQEILHLEVIVATAAMRSMIAHVSCIRPPEACLSFEVFMLAWP